MLEDCGCALLLSNAEGMASLPDEAENVEQVVLVSDCPQDAQGHGHLRTSCEWTQPETSDLNPPLVNTGKDILYLLHTSGSTGLPKGAKVRHDGALNHMYAEFRALEFHTGTAFLQSAPASSDISVWQCLGPLLTGGRTVFADYSTLCSAVDLFGLIREEEVTLIELVPVVLEGLIHFAETQPGELSRLPKLERAMVTGEAVSATLVRRWFGIWPGVPLISYGPTEAADDICQYEMREAPDPSTAVVPIGTPVDNMSVMVLDSRGELLPAGLPGEICVSGIGVGDGYWRQAENTAAAFVPIHSAAPLGATCSTRPAIWADGAATVCSNSWAGWITRSKFAVSVSNSVRSRRR